MVEKNDDVAYLKNLKTYFFYVLRIFVHIVIARREKKLSAT
jgi:hypothetical protein